MSEAYIYDAIRTPRGRGRPDGALHEVTALRLSALVLDGLRERNGLDGPVLEDVIWGNATQIGEQGGCLARSAVLASGLDAAIPGLSINRFCASGLEAVMLGAAQVQGGLGQAYLAGGVEMKRGWRTMLERPSLPADWIGRAVSVSATASSERRTPQTSANRPRSDRVLSEESRR